jgi:hypothetical protein
MVMDILYVLKISDDGDIEESIGGSLLLPPDEYIYCFEVSQETAQNLYLYKVLDGKLITK